MKKDCPWFAKLCRKNRKQISRPISGPEFNRQNSWKCCLGWCFCITPQLSSQKLLGSNFQSANSFSKEKKFFENSDSDFHWLLSWQRLRARTVGWVIESGKWMGDCWVCTLFQHSTAKPTESCFQTINKANERPRPQNQTLLCYMIGSAAKNLIQLPSSACKLSFSDPVTDPDNRLRDTP